MDSELITAASVREALRAIRVARPLHESPLLQLGILTARLRREALADTTRSRESLLPRFLDELVRERLAELRGSSARDPRAGLSPEDEIRLVERDFQQRSTELEAWSLLHLRYFSASRASLPAVSERLGVSRRTLARRTDTGYQLLADLLVGLELSERPVEQHNLPATLTRFIGREREMAEVRALLAENRLVTLTGPGGIGKSRLAVEIGRGLVPDYTDGVWLVELGAVDDADLVVRAVASTFELREQPKRGLTDTLVDHLSDKHILLLLDNCERQTRASADLAEDFLVRCPDMQIVATSGERLHVAGECVFSVQPLDLPILKPEARPRNLILYDSVRLFVDRAAAVLPGFRLTPGNAAHIAEVCIALDGIPLATELAAARIGVLSPRELAGRVDNVLELLANGRRAARPHHETLRATIAWSHEYLDEPEQVLFRRLSVFRSGWDLEAAEGICAGGPLEARGILGLLSQLADKSLIEARREAGQTRYDMLTTVRRFAQDRWEQGDDTEAARDSHLGYYLALAESAESELKEAGQAEWLHRLAAEHDNLTAALRWTVESDQAERGLRLSGALARFWELQGFFQAGRKWLAVCLAMPDAAVHLSARAKALSGAGALAEEQADFVAAESLHRESLAVRREIDDAVGVAESLNNLGNVANLRGDYGAAQALHAEALEKRRELGDDWGVAASLNNLGNVAEYQGDFDEARTLYEESAALLEDLGDRWAQSVTLNNLGLVASDQGDWEAARGYASRSLGIARELGDRQGMAYALHTLGDIAFRQGRLEEARQLHAQSLNLARELGDRQGMAESLESFAILAHAEDDPERSAELFGAAHVLRERIDSPWTAAAEPARRSLISELHTALGPEAFDAAWEAGATSGEADAVELALGED